MTTKSIGDNAEEIVARQLRKNGYKVLARNWRTPYCELDIVASRQRVVCVVEVKYRDSQRFGGGLAAINNAKLQKLQLGANLWAQSTNWKGDMAIIIAAVDQYNHIEWCSLD